MCLPVSVSVQVRSIRAIRMHCPLNPQLCLLCDFLLQPSSLSSMLRFKYHPQRQRSYAQFSVSRFGKCNVLLLRYVAAATGKNNGLISGT